MSAFNPDYFLENPSILQINSCRADELVKIANHGGLTSLQAILEKDFRALVIGKLERWKLGSLCCQSNQNLPHRNTMSQEEEKVSAAAEKGERQG